MNYVKHGSVRTAKKPFPSKRENRKECPIEQLRWRLALELNARLATLRKGLGEEQNGEWNRVFHSGQRFLPSWV
jgi:hypothetical protein